MNLYDKLYGRYAVEDINFTEDLPINFEELKDHLLKIQEINRYYVKKVLKKLIDTNVFPDELDWVYEEYVKLLNENGENQYDKLDIIRYFFDTNDQDRVTVDIYEKPDLISARSTTGFRTWEASLFMGKYLLQNEEIVKNKRILELGCGTGICSLVILKGTPVTKLYSTDGDSELVSQQLVKNFELNKINRDTDDIVLQRLWWSEDKVPEDIDVVIGADITFDESIFDVLCGCLVECLDHCKECFISATIRNERSNDLFISTCKSLGMHVEEVAKTTDLQGRKPLLAPIAIYRITK